MENKEKQPKWIPKNCNKSQEGTTNGYILVFKPKRIVIRYVNLKV